VNPARLLKWKYSTSLFSSGANTVCSVVFQLEVLRKLGVGTRSDLYYASIIIPTVLFTLVFGALTNVLVPMFVVAKARGGHEETALLWNCLFITSLGGLTLMAFAYYPARFFFPLLFHKLGWIDIPQVMGVIVAFCLYQVLYCGVTVKNCFLFAEGHPTSAQAGIFCGWLVSLFFLWRFVPGDGLGKIPLCLAAGNAVALAFPNLGSQTFHYEKGFLGAHASSLLSRNLPLMVGGSISSRLEPLFDGVLASFCRAGSLTVYFFFGRIMLYVATITSSGYMQPVQKVLAEIAGERSWVALRQRTKTLAIRATLITLGLLTFAVMFLAFLYLWGFGPAKPYFQYFAGDLPVFFLMLGYLVGMLVAITYSNSLFILRKERLFLWASLAVFPAGILLKFVGAYKYGLGGLALGTSVYWVLNAGALVFVFSRHLDLLEAGLGPRVDGEDRVVEIAAISSKRGGVLT
jgi:O-antigen/teichoic acid export membrane protein